MEIALPRAGWKQRPQGIRSLENWLVCWVVLPNLGFWLLWVIGGPPRAFSIIVAGFVGVLVHRAPFPVKFACFVLTLASSVLFFIAALFNLSILSLFQSLKFAAELQPSASIEYVVGGACLAATLAGAWWMLRRPTTLVQPTRIIFALGATVLAASVDTMIAKGSLGSYNRVPVAGAPFTSAVSESRLLQVASGDRHVLMVMVEAMGQPTDPRLQRRLIDLWAPPEVRARYEVTTGDSIYYGSTTSGEMRELCGRWGDYHEVMERRDPGCLPAQLAARGYHSQAWHSFDGSMFDRTQWYPNIGFGEMRFGPQLVADGAQMCPGVFPGACDRDVPRQIRTVLRQARQPQFLYWLTVNSHLPVLRNERLQTEHCASFDARLDEEHPMVCRLLSLFDQTAAALAREISSPGFPETDILIVGDHMPPFFDRSHRNQFEPDRVPWILLRPKARTPQLHVASAS